ncbi:hypothetical protein I5K02_21085 [Pseudomonas aeruginosa]|nr:hypothetical protein [Pseudomonas aeruginosa]
MNSLKKSVSAGKYFKIAITLLSLPASTASIAEQRLEFTVNNVYITQSTQNYERSISLIEGRRGLLRVFVQATKTNNARPKVFVKLLNNGTIADEFYIEPDPSLKGVPTPEEFNQDNYTQSYNKEIPAERIKKGLQIQVVVDPSGEIVNCTITQPCKNRYWPRDNIPPEGDWPRSEQNLITERVVTVPDMKVEIVPISFTLPTSPPEPAKKSTPPAIDLSYAKSSTDHVLHMHPVKDSIETSLHEVLNVPFYVTQTPDKLDTWNRLLGVLSATAKIENKVFTHYVGALNPIHWDFDKDIRFGWGETPGYSSFAVHIPPSITPIKNPEGVDLFTATMAHEIGHNFSLGHVNCNTPEGNIRVSGYNVWTKKNI